MSANVVTRGALRRCISSRTNSCAAYIATLGANGARKVGWRAMLGKGHGIRLKAVLEMESTVHDWQTLGLAVANVIDHQSQASTDIRWFNLMFRIQAGGMFFPQDMEEGVRQIGPRGGNHVAQTIAIRMHKRILERSGGRAGMHRCFGGA